MDLRLIRPCRPAEEVSGFVATNEFTRKYGVTDIPAAFKINPDGTLGEKLHGVPNLQ